jgi:predicted kinase
MDDTGYRVAYAVAEDNLRLGHTVIADSVNPLVLTRNAWINVARRVGVEFIEVECQCSEEREHRRRIDTRVADIPGLVLPTWADVTARQYDTWDRARLVIETTNNLEDNVTTIRAAIESRAS